MVITIHYRSNYITSFFIADSLGFRNVLPTEQIWSSSSKSLNIQDPTM
jgi:hypothetical protein